MDDACYVYQYAVIVTAARCSAEIRDSVGPIQNLVQLVLYRGRSHLQGRHMEKSYEKSKNTSMRVLEGVN